MKNRTLKKIRNWISKKSKTNPLVRITAKRVYWFIYKVRFLPYFIGYYSIDPHMILFNSFKGKYCDSPKAIYEQLLIDERYRDYTFIWVVEDTNHTIPANGRQVVSVQYNSPQYRKYLSKAKFILTNSRLPVQLIKKRRQIIIQTWHGTPLKRLGCDIKVDYDNPYNSVKQVYRQYEYEARKMDYLISPSAYASEKLSSTFHLKKYRKEGCVLEIGYPRNDFLKNHTIHDVQSIRAKLNLPKNKKILLYAPTFRDNKHEVGVGYTFLPEIDFAYLKQELQEEYIILFRTHYFVSKSLDFTHYNGFIYDVSSFDDINELYIVSDILITDYSSVFFDFAILKRPILFYMYDLESYQNQLRGFYLRLDELPGPVLQDEIALADSIKQLNPDEYLQPLTAFTQKYNYLDDGNASKRAIEQIGFR